MIEIVSVVKPGTVMCAGNWLTDLSPKYSDHNLFQLYYMMQLLLLNDISYIATCFCEPHLYNRIFVTL